MKSKKNLSQASEPADTFDSYRTRLAALPFPLIALIILLMGIAKYFG